jgi:hypothetical protein
VMEGDFIKKVESAGCQPRLANESARTKIFGAVVEVVNDVLDELER